MTNFYNYKPSLIGNIVCAGLFLLLTILHAILAIKNRMVYFIPVIVGAACASHLPTGRLAR